MLGKRGFVCIMGVWSLIKEPKYVLNYRKRQMENDFTLSVKILAFVNLTFVTVITAKMAK